MKVQIIKPFGEYEADQIVDLEDDLASLLIQGGYAQEVPSEEVPDKEDDEEDVDKAADKLSKNISASLAKNLDAIADKVALKIAKKAPAPFSLAVSAEAKDTKYGFKSLTDYCLAVREADRNNSVDARKKLDHVSGQIRQKATYLNATTASEGANLVPETFADFIWDKVREESPLYSKITKWKTQTNNLTVPSVSESSLANGSRFGGLRAYWVDENAQATLSKPAFGQIQLRLNKLVTYIQATDEIMRFNPYSLQTVFEKMVPQEIGFVLDDAIMNGAGTTEPVGITGHAATVVVSKESGQTASTINYQNIVKMLARCWGPNQRKAVFIINPDCLPSIYSMTYPTSSGTAQGYLPSNGTVNNLQYGFDGTLLGKPMILSQAAKTVGTVGDITLCDLEAYAGLVPAVDQMIAASTIYVDFDRLMETFRFHVYFDGKPTWASALTPFNGSNTFSWAVQLQSRT